MLLTLPSSRRIATTGEMTDGGTPPTRTIESVPSLCDPPSIHRVTVLTAGAAAEAVYG
jgi:hypothetical protein